VRDARIGRPGREAQPVEEDVGDDDDDDEREDEDRLAVGLQPPRLQDETPPERVAHRGQHRDLHQVLEQRVGGARRPGNHRQRVVADDDEVELAHEQRAEAEEDRRVHEPGLPVARDHARLAEAHDRHPRQARAGIVPAHLGLQRAEDGDLAPGERGKAAKARYHEQRYRPGSHLSSRPE
jgi:hypothetical protein